MQKVLKKIFAKPSLRLNTLVVLEVVILLLVSLGGLLYFTRQALVVESKKDAEQRLEGTVQHVDNVLVGIEQAAGNFYYELLEHLDEPECMPVYCRRLVECDPNIVGCVIAFEQGFFPGHDHYITYVHRRKYNSPELIISDKSEDKSYFKQEWYSETIKTGRPAWMSPEQNKDFVKEPVVVFCLPIRDRSSECVGVMAVALSVNLLSQIVLANKPSPHSYSLLLGHDGTYIIHPDREKLSGQTVFQQPEVAESQSAVAAFKDMIESKTGDQSFVIDDVSWYVFYKPFVRANIPGRSMEALHWSIGTVYPKSDIFGEYNHLVLHVLAIVFIGLLVFYILCRSAIRKQLSPLAYLTVSAERIAEGHYDEPVPDTKRDDEVGVFQQQFQMMQRALDADIRKQQELQATLNERREELRAIHDQIEEDEQVKTTFLHNVTNRMIPPSESILESVNRLSENAQELSLQEANREIDNIKQQSDTILELLSHKFNPVSHE